MNLKRQETNIKRLFGGVILTAKRKQRKKVPEQKIASALDMPKILSPSVPHIEFEGNREAVIDGDKISLSAGSLTVTFRGSDLTLCSYSDEQSVIKGSIISIEFTG